jgi:hypothetical protein
MTIEARLQINTEAEQRGWPRRKLYLGSNLQAGGEPVTIHDLSSTGLLIETEAGLAPFDSIGIELPEVGLAQALVVWSGGHFHGCQFKERVSQAAISAALLRSLPARPVEAARPQQFVQAQPDVASALDVETIEEDHIALDDERASPSVRLRVILGSAVLLWTLIIWTAFSLIKIFR